MLQCDVGQCAHSTTLCLVVQTVRNAWRSSGQPDLRRIDGLVVLQSNDEMRKQSKCASMLDDMNNTGGLARDV